MGTIFEPIILLKIAFEYISVTKKDIDMQFSLKGGKNERPPLTPFM